MSGPVTMGGTVAAPTPVLLGYADRFSVEAGETIRFMVIKKPNGYGTALDACLICGAEGYRQDGQNVICRHCASAIYVPTIGQKGGCNPIGFSSRLDGDNIVIDVGALSKAAEEIPK